jgi:ATP-dependent DNA ligase
LVLKTKVRSDDKYIYCKPKVVIEVAGQEKTKSRIPSVPVFDRNLKQIKKIQGWSIRMPRMTRIRDDKHPVYKDIRAEQLYSGGVGGWQESSLF